MEQYLIDTNIVSDYLSNSFSVAGIEFMDEIIDAVPNISIITKIELLCWDTDLNTYQNVESFISDSIVLQINSEVVRQCVKIRKGKKIKTPDAIIAATAITYNFTIVTKNEKDFENIEGLKIINPSKL